MGIAMNADVIRIPPLWRRIFGGYVPMITWWCLSILPTLLASLLVWAGNKWLDSLSWAMRLMENATGRWSGVAQYKTAVFEAQRTERREQMLAALKEHSV